MEYENSSIVPTEFSISYLGEYLYSILSKRVEDAYDVLYKIVREWSVDFAVQKLLNLMVLINPCLNRHRRAQLEPLLTRSLDQLLWQRDRKSVV